MRKIKTEVADLNSLCSAVMDAKGYDAEISRLCNKAREYARVYLFAKKTKGCNGLGEMEALLEEFRKMLYEVIVYVRKKKYIDDPAIYNIDFTDQELEKLSVYLEASHEQ